LIVIHGQIIYRVIFIIGDNGQIMNSFGVASQDFSIEKIVVANSLERLVNSKIDNYF
tara:strand:+ start:184 stop:354 length:171 start_codon:yes stop_codon:yes gene_type:complete